MTFRCGRCAELVKAADELAPGKTATCQRCQHVNIVPDVRTAPPAVRLVRRERVKSPASQLLLAAAGIVAVAAAGWGVWSLVGASGATAAAPRTPAEALQQELLFKNLGEAGDPTLSERYQNINARHFGGALPAIPVRWEPRLAEVGHLGDRRFTLQGMFGHAGRRSVILINPSLQGDPAAVARTLSHEMVHAFLHAKGDKSGGHGPSFQQLLRRIGSEGAFQGVVATDDDRASLRSWLDAESARLDAARAELQRLRGDLDRERRDVERALEDLNTRVSTANTQGRGWPSDAEIAMVTSRRDAYNQRALEASDQFDRDRASLEYFNREVERYNLMLVYPDGLDERPTVTPKPVQR